MPPEQDEYEDMPGLEENSVCSEQDGSDSEDELPEPDRPWRPRAEHARAGVGPDTDDLEASFQYLKWLEEWRADPFTANVGCPPASACERGLTSRGARPQRGGDAPLAAQLK